MVMEHASQAPVAGPILEVKGLHVHFSQGRGKVVRAVDNLSFTLGAGETLGIVGESGSGKTTVVRAVLRIIDSPGRIAAGEIVYRGRDLLKLPEREMRRLRGSKIAMIFQDPTGSLDPLHTIGDQFVETIRTHHAWDRARAYRRAAEVLRLVGVQDPAAAMSSYPMEFSAGMIQRMMIGMAISCEPDVILADEPTTGLGVVLQAQILNELMSIQKRLGTSMILITHDMGVVAHVADDIMVMYAGECVEYGSKEQVLLNPMHPYTLGLMRSVPQIDQARLERLPAIPGFPPDLTALGPGCPFAPRCDRQVEESLCSRPPLVEMEPGHFVACHNPVPPNERLMDVHAATAS
jgi:oligopeptide/dipeptide ABC transporter ATP-binding protein